MFFFVLYNVFSFRDYLWFIEYWSKYQNWRTDAIDDLTCISRHQITNTDRVLILHCHSNQNSFIFFFKNQKQQQYTTELLSINTYVDDNWTNHFITAWRSKAGVQKCDPFGYISEFEAGLSTVFIQWNEFLSGYVTVLQRITMTDICLKTGASAK